MYNHKNLNTTRNVSGGERRTLSARTASVLQPERPSTGFVACATLHTAWQNTTREGSGPSLLLLAGGRETRKIQLVINYILNKLYTSSFFPAVWLYYIRNKIVI